MARPLAAIGCEHGGSSSGINIARHICSETNAGFNRKVDLCLLGGRPATTIVDTGVTILGVVITISYGHGLETLCLAITASIFETLVDVLIVVARPIDTVRVVVCSADRGLVAGALCVGDGRCRGKIGRYRTKSTTARIFAFVVGIATNFLQRRRCFLGYKRHKTLLTSGKRCLPGLAIVMVQRGLGTVADRCLVLIDTVSGACPCLAICMTLRCIALVRTISSIPPTLNTYKIDKYNRK